MDRDPQEDPGGDPPPSGSCPEQGSELTDLKEQFEHQQVLIAQLKEMLRKTDPSNVTQEKVDRYASTLSKMTVRAKKSKLKKETAGATEIAEKTTAGAPVNEKISLLRRQLEENKAKLAERGRNQKGIEEMVTQLKAQFDDSLQLINDTSSNFSFIETKTDYTKDSSSDELYNILVIKEKKITDLHQKVQKLEATVLDLQENLKEKDCVIDARTKAITLMTESLSKKGKTTQDTLDDTKEQMRKMQENFVTIENEMKTRQNKLLDDLRLKNLEIAELQESIANLKHQTPDESSQSLESAGEYKKIVEDLKSRIKELESLNNDLQNKNENLTPVGSEASNENIRTLETQIENLKEEHKHQHEVLQKALEEAQIENEDCKRQIQELRDSSRDSKQSSPAKSIGKDDNQKEETSKLKKDLDDLNKNMAKLKAEHKKKVKILNKKIDSFKKIGDLNAHVVKLSDENDILSEKIAVLEEEKGHYQLKMIDSPSMENIEEMKSKILELSASLEAKEKEVITLQSENEILQQKLEASDKELKKLTDLQNARVTSEITSIQYEELSEELQKDKDEIMLTKESLEKEHMESLEKIEILIKEKAEIQAKLDHYIQDNMELIDKLEKLSAEKVSSAESIEIVENLTQQEKLELEEYQKNLDPQSGKMKMSQEHLEGTPDLNDSVNQLNEETSELLQKIELFTEERREVMEKMEFLANENSQLSLKLKQIENNRDLLTETYEQLQSEKEEVDDKIKTLEDENKNLMGTIESMKKEFDIEEKEELKKKLFDLEGEYIKLCEINANLNRELKANAELIHEKNEMEVELREARNKIEELQEHLQRSLEEINTYQSVIEENKEEFINSAAHLNELNDTILEKENELRACKTEVEKLNSIIDDLKETIHELQDENLSNKENIQKIEQLEKQLEALKKTLNDNLTQLADYENELEENTSNVKELNQQLKELKNKNTELQELLGGKNEENDAVIKNLTAQIQHLENQVKSKDEVIHKVSSEMKEKFMSLQKQTDDNTESLENIREPLQKKIDELTSKNTALIEKMKKIAANLKKKTQSCQELEEQLHATNEKWEKELSEKNSRIEEAEEMVKSLKDQLEMQQSKTEQIQYGLKEVIQEDVLQKQAVEVRSDISLQQELSGSSIVAETIPSSANTSLSKIQELELIIETQENDIASYKKRIGALEEMLAQTDEMRETLEQKTNELGAQLKFKSLSFEEISKSEDLLEEKLKNFAKYNDDLSKKLEETTRDNVNVLQENKNLKEAEEKLKHKLSVAQERVNELLEVQQNIVVLEQELEKSKNHINHLEQEVRKLDVEKTEIEKQALSDIERLDIDWQSQFDTLSREKTELTVQCEKLQEKVYELTESEQVLSEKIAELQSKLDASSEIQEINSNQLAIHANEIQVLQEKLGEKQAEIDGLLLEITNLKSMQQNEASLIEELERLKVENNNLNVKLEVTLTELNSIQNTLQTTNDELVQLKANTQNTHMQQQLFSWPQQQEDPFHFVSSSQQESAVQTKSTDEELIQKIKTLEFMLKNVENERDEVLNQCSHLSNELMRIVYEKEAQQNTSRQIPTTSENVDGAQPVVEPVCVKKETYLCYPDENLTSIESQVLPDDFLRESCRNELQRLEFTKTRDVNDDTGAPFTEEKCEKKEAYLCHPDEGEMPGLSSQPDHVNVDAFGGDDDGWGWNPEEARLEEQHKNEYETNPLRIKIVELEDKIKVMEIERNNKNKEYQELQVKSGKLIKKLKEMKNKNEKLQHGKRQDDDFFNLENTIQEELKLQIQTLEKRISEVSNELSKEKSDKQALQKKLETLSASNQRIAEMKEKQDIEMLMWQRKSEELKLKLDQLEWSDGSPEKINKHKVDLDKETDGDLLKMQQKIAELNEVIKELTIDNEELQTLLEEQRSLRITAEKAKSIEPIPDNMKTESEFMEIVNQKYALEQEMNNLTYDNKRLHEELNEIIKQNTEQTQMFQNIESEKHQLERMMEERTTLLQELSNNSERLQAENEKLEKILADRSYDENLVQELLEKIKVLEENQTKTLVEETTVLINERDAILTNLQEKINIIEVLNKEKELLLHELNDKENAIKQLESNVDEKTALLKNELEIQIQRTKKLIQENESLQIQTKEFEEQINELSSQIQQKDLEFEAQISKLNQGFEEKIKELSEQNQRKDVEFEAEIAKLCQEWQSLVNQRGSDVAESWKLHLDSRENEFSQLQEQLRKEINDLEEKCNGLVNENNELRKNVDTEIRNEVDRISALQQQINERQVFIHELTQAVNEKQIQVDNAEHQINQLQNNIASLEKIIEEKNIKINDLQIIVDATQKQFDDKRIIVEGIVRKLEERSSSPILFDLESVLEELNRQLGNKINEEELSNLYKELSDKDSIISNIRNELSAKIEEINSHELIIQNHVVTIEELKKQIENNNAVEKINELSLRLNEKETLITSLEKELNVKSKEIQCNMENIEELKLYRADTERQVKILSDRLLEKDEWISSLSNQLQETQNSKETENDTIQNLQYNLQQYQTQYDELRTNLTEKQSLIDALNEELERQQKIHVDRESDVQKLKSFVEELQKSHELEINQLEKDKNEIIENQNQEVEILRNQLSQVDSYINEMKSDREMMQETVNQLQLQIQEHRNYIEELNKQLESYRITNEQLNEKLNEQQKKYDEQNVLLDEEDKQVGELRALIEDQVLKIEELKQKLYEKSNDYDSLIAQMDVRNDLITQPSTRPPMGQGQLIGPSSEDDLHEWVSRPELDIALYMLHQRDVRCEELTVELTQLLEERDTLQLRLSNALREKEEIKKLVLEEGRTITSSSENSPSKGAIPKGKVSEIVLKSSGTELATEAQELATKESDAKLENKLSELKNIGYKRDKTLLDEQQQRRLQQLSIMQQHIEEASKLPPEAAARLVDANYTLSRDVQSPSKVLLNWLWGKSTPKVNEL